MFGQHQRGEGHRDDLFGLPAVQSRSSDLGQLHKTEGQSFNTFVCINDFFFHLIEFSNMKSSYYQFVCQKLQFL